MPGQSFPVAYSLVTKTFFPLLTAEIGQSGSPALICSCHLVLTSGVFIKSNSYLSGVYK